MTGWILTYVVIFCILLIGNAVFWVKHRGKLWVLLYEIASGTYLIYCVLVFLYPEILNFTTRWPLAAIPAVLAFECYYSIWGDTEDLLPDDSEQMTATELEFAKGFSVLLAAPAYIIAAKLFMNTFL